VHKKVVTEEEKSQDFLVRTFDGTHRAGGSKRVGKTAFYGEKELMSKTWEKKERSSVPLVLGKGGRR